MQKTATELLVWYFERHKVKILDDRTITFVHLETRKELPVRFKIVGEITHESSWIPDHD